jgi:hypothetical protein
MFQTPLGIGMLVLQHESSCVDNNA